MNETIFVNQLPVRTWNRLGVNETALTWDEAAMEMLETERISPQGESIRLDIAGRGACSGKSVEVEVPEGQTCTVLETIRPEADLLVRTGLKVKKDAKVRLVQILHTGENARLRCEVTGSCEEQGRVELVQILLGRGDVYSDSRFTLNGTGSGLKADMGYLGRGEQTVDINLVADHYGPKTESVINVSGALKDGAKKIFRGTIDFKKGAVDAVGSEQETVLMLGDDVVNKTVPLILCAEENVEGNHGASIGELDGDTLFYFESRGISRELAENIMARAAIERLAGSIGDEAAKEYVLKNLEEEL